MLFLFYMELLSSIYGQAFIVYFTKLMLTERGISKDQVKQNKTKQPPPLK